MYAAWGWKINSQAKLAADYPWIPSEEPLFGVKGGDYDWNARSAEAAVAELKELADAHDKQSKKVNKKVLAMFDKAEGEYQELVAKRAIVEKDKEKIQQVRLMLFFFWVVITVLAKGGTRNLLIWTGGVASRADQPCSQWHPRVS